MRLGRKTKSNSALFAMALALFSVVFSTTAFGHSFFTFFAGRTAPFTPVPIKFDLNSSDPYGVLNNTVTYLISNQGPTALEPGDSFPALVSQIRAAANVWNTVGTSGIRLAYGGLAQLPTGDATPQIDVVFSDDIPP